jgi:hypothetical protein
LILYLCYCIKLIIVLFSKIVFLLLLLHVRNRYHFNTTTVIEERDMLQKKLLKIIEAATEPGLGSAGRLLPKTVTT